MKKEAAKSDIILIPTDFSEVCENAIEHGLTIAKQLKFRVYLFHVINEDTRNYLADENLQEDAITSKMEQRAKEAQEAHGIEVQSIVKTGNFFKQIAKVSKKIDARLIILGTHGKVGFQKLTGSFALKVISLTDVPTIVVQKKAYKDGYRNIVFPITATTPDRQKVAWAVNLAKVFGATIHLFPRYESESHFKTKIMNVTKQIKNILDNYDVKYVDKVSEPGAGNFAKQVIDYALVHEAELIMAVISKDKLLPVFSTLDEQLVFNTSQIPVICINPASVFKTSWAWS